MTCEGKGCWKFDYHKIKQTHDIKKVFNCDLVGNESKFFVTFAKIKFILMFKEMLKGEGKMDSNVH